MDFEFFETEPEDFCRFRCIVMSGHGLPARFTWCSYRNIDCPYLHNPTQCSDYEKPFY